MAFPRSAVSLSAEIERGSSAFTRAVWPFAAGKVFMRLSFVSKGVVCATLLAATGIAVAGCSGTGSSQPQTVGEKTEMQGKQIQDAGDMGQKGEKMVAEGQGKVAQGETLTSQGKLDDGKKLADEGHQLVNQGRTMIQQAQEVKDRAMNMPVTTAPSAP